MDTLIEDVLGLILITVHCRLKVRLVCKWWLKIDREATKRRIITELNPRYMSLQQLLDVSFLGPPDRIEPDGRETRIVHTNRWIPYIGSDKLYIGLVRTLGKLFDSGDKVYTFNCNWDDSEEFERAGIKVKRNTSLKQFATSTRTKISAKTPILLERTKKTPHQRQVAERYQSGMVVLVPAQSKPIKDLTDCPTCLRICKHCHVRVGENCVEQSSLGVVLSVFGSIESSRTLIHGELVFDEIEETGTRPYIRRDVDKVARIGSYLKAARELGYEYIKYSLETGEIHFLSIGE